MYRFSHALSLINKEIWAIDNDIRTTRDDRRYNAEVEDTYIAEELLKLSELRGAKELLEMFKEDTSGDNT